MPDWGTRRSDPARYAREYRKKNAAAQSAWRREYHERRKADPDYVEMRRRSDVAGRRKRKYGVTREQYAVMLTAQSGRCKVCNEFRGDGLRVDHCHATGKVRGLLCDSCNNGLGRFRDNPERLRRAARYIEEQGPCLGLFMRQPEPTAIMR